MSAASASFVSDTLSVGKSIAIDAKALLDLVAAGSEHDDVDEQVRRFAASYFSRFLCVFSLSLFRSTVVLSLFSFDCRCAFRSPGCRCASPDRMIFGWRSAARRTVFRIIS